MIRRMFIGAAILGLAVNLLGDISILRQAKKSSESDDWVTHSYKISRAIDATRVEVLQSVLSHQINPKLKPRLEALAELVKDVGPQKDRALRLIQLSDEALLRTNDNPALPILNQMGASEDAMLESRIKVDFQTDETSSRQALLSNGVDLLLIFLFLAFFLYEYQTNAKLRRSLAQTLMQVEESNVKLAETLASRDAKFKTVVHDLKNPLGAIRGYAELLNDDPANRSSVNRMATVIQKISNDTLSLVGSVLEASDHAEGSKDYFDISKVLAETCAHLEPVAIEKKQRIKVLKCGKSFLIHAQRRQVQDIFYNLIGNALKFSNPSTTVTVECRSDANDLEVLVRDQGPGFKPDDFEEIFQPGAKLSAKPTGHETSTGFGLYSAKKAIAALGGKILITNNPTVGACVKIVIPILNEKTAADRGSEIHS